MRAELSADREQGAGFGLMRITGLPVAADVASGPMDFSLRCNQGTAPFLGSDGRWQAAEAWHSVAAGRPDGTGALVVPLGPAVIDPIVGQPTNVTYLLTVAVGATKQATPLKVIRPLFGSGAAAGTADAAIGAEPPDDAARQAEEEARLRAEEEARRRSAEEESARLAHEEAERRRLADEAAQQAALDDARKAGRRRTALFAGLGLALVLAAAAGGGWYGCVIPGFAAGRCQAAKTPSPLPVPEASLSCTGLDAAGCYQVGERALQQKQLEPARQLLQQASGLGSAEASIALGRMYDPDTWSAETSPATQPNWETAAFWYEKAARQGNVAAKVKAGRLMCKNAKDDLERGQARAYLEQAANAGDGEARQLLPTCQQ